MFNMVEPLRRKPIDKSLPENVEDAVDVRYSAKDGCLYLACDPGAFDLLRKQFIADNVGGPDIPFDEVVSIRIVDIVSFNKRNNVQAVRTRPWGCFIVLISILALAIVGLVQTVRWLAGW